MKRAPGKNALACVMGDMDLVRPLGLAGIGCAVVTQPGNPALHSRHTRSALFWDDVSQDPEGLVDALLRFGHEQHEPPILFYEDDAHLLLVSRHRERLMQAFRFVIADPELVETLADKRRFQDLAERLDLPVPPARRLRPADGSLPGDLDLRFPVVVKPLTRRKPWDQIDGFAKALRVDSMDDLRALWPRLVELGMDLLAQEMIPGPESRVESYHVYIDRWGKIAGEFTGRKLRTYPLAFGHSTALTVTDEDDVIDLGRSIVKALALRGVAKIDFKRGPDGTLHLLKVNPRFSLWHHLGAVAGVNLPAMVYADLVGLPRPAVQYPQAGACWCHIANDRIAARESGVVMAEWLPWALRCEAKAVAWDDPMPFLRNMATRALWKNRAASSASAGSLAKS